MSARTISIGSEFPKFKKKAVVSIDADAPGKEFAEITNDIHLAQDKWLVLFWWPKDFTFVCPTEIAAFNKIYDGLDDRDTVLLGASTDSEYVHLAWRKDNENYGI